jgi:hypothetical protein
MLPLPDAGDNVGFEGMIMADTTDKQLLHLVLGGELTALDSVEFKDLSKVDLVGVYPSYKAAHDAWRAKAQATVDQAQTRYFVVHLHRLMDPDTAKSAG